MGVWRAGHEDFRVEEVPLKPPSGDGGASPPVGGKARRLDHRCASRLCRVLRVPEADAGYAGLKDADAVTRQWFSFRTKTRDAPAAVSELADMGIRVLDSARSRTRIRRGALAGNRFDILIRDVTPEAEPKAREILDCPGRARAAQRVRRSEVRGSRPFGANRLCAREKRLARSARFAAWRRQAVHCAGACR